MSPLKKLANPHYLVLGLRGVPMELARFRNTPKKGVLMDLGEATMFQSWKLAKQAIDRTGRYAEKENYDWNCDWFRIMRIATHQKNKPL